MTYAQFVNDALTAYSIQLKENPGALEIRSALKAFRPCETMRLGYEFMAEINLDFCEFGLTDCLSALKNFETIVNGEDKESDC